MIRLFVSVTIFLLLFTIEVSFIHSLPYPVDRIPLLLIATVYLYQYGKHESVVWWLPAYGALLDVLSISAAPREVVSYGVATIMLLLTSRHVFTNRSFYGMAAMALLCTFALGVSQSMIISMDHLLHGAPVFWAMLWTIHAWSALFASITLLFLAPPLHRVLTRWQNVLLEHI